MFPGLTNGVTVTANTRYSVTIYATLIGLGSGAINDTALGFRQSDPSDCSITQINYQVVSGQTNTQVSQTNITTNEASFFLTSGFAPNYHAFTQTLDYVTFRLQGTIDIDGAGGYLLPQINNQNATGTSYQIQALSYIQLIPIGPSGQITNIGGWS